MLICMAYGNKFRISGGSDMMMQEAFKDALMDKQIAIKEMKRLI